MTGRAFRSWQAVQQEVRRRIHAREWQPGELIPNEADLAREFGCARATVNRALRSVAETGLLDRRRKAGTRVTLQPVAKATLEISLIRHEIEARNARYGYTLLSCETEPPPPATAAAFEGEGAASLMHVRALHLADGAPYALEDRWINPSVVSAGAARIFEKISPNEWLLAHTPYTDGDIAFSAVNALGAVSEALGVAEGDAVFLIDRTTRDHDLTITSVRLYFVPGYRMRTVL